MSEKKEDKPADNKESQDMIERYEPRFALEQVALNEKVKEQIQTAIAAVRYKTSPDYAWKRRKGKAGRLEWWFCSIWI